MKQLIFSILFFILVNQSNGQANIVSDTSVVYPQLKSYLNKGLKDTIGMKMGLIMQINLLDSTNNKFGVFRFIKMSSEGNYLLYLRNYGENKITIVPKYDVDIVMSYLSSYFFKNKKHINYKERLECTKRVLDVLLQRLD